MTRPAGRHPWKICRIVLFVSLLLSLLAIPLADHLQAGIRWLSRLDLNRKQVTAAAACSAVLLLTLLLTWLVVVLNRKERERELKEQLEAYMRALENPHEANLYALG